MIEDTRPEYTSALLVAVGSISGLYLAERHMSLQGKISDERQVRWQNAALEHLGFSDNILALKKRLDEVDQSMSTHRSERYAYVKCAFVGVENTNAKDLLTRVLWGKLMDSSGEINPKEHLNLRVKEILTEMGMQDDIVDAESVATIDLDTIISAILTGQLGLAPLF